MIIYDTKKFIDKLIVNFEMTSFNKKIINPTAIDINKTLKKFSFLWNLLVKPITTKANTTINTGFKISDR